MPGKSLLFVARLTDSCCGLCFPWNYDQSCPTKALSYFSNSPLQEMKSYTQYAKGQGKAMGPMWRSCLWLPGTVLWPLMSCLHSEQGVRQRLWQSHQQIEETISEGAERTRQLRFHNSRSICCRKSFRKCSSHEDPGLRSSSLPVQTRRQHSWFWHELGHLTQV